MCAVLDAYYHLALNNGENGHWEHTKETVTEDTPSP